ncbi:hypothetical protein V5O48_011039 [Marasmius crinis-equi]|uniref:Chromatin elongation factor spt5 n=1 Tax=Marasmius crinis-equi TaxID=585013 RepID=A0ABR3F6S0_9AGAR
MQHVIDFVPEVESDPEDAELDVVLENENSIMHDKSSETAISEVLQTSRHQHSATTYRCDPDRLPREELADNALLYRTISSEYKDRPPFVPGEWVRVLYGLYEGDVAQVYRTSRAVSGEVGYLVFLVPRLPSLDEMRSKKRKKRPTLPRRLFDPKQYDIDVPPQKSGQYAGYKFRGLWLSHGLLIKFFHVRDLISTLSVPPDTPTLFANHPFCQKFPIPVVDLWNFQTWEEVDVSGDMKAPNGRGHLIILEDGQLRVDFGAGILYPVARANLKKVVIPGDMVSVVTPGEERHGVVIEKYGTLLALGDMVFPEIIRFFAHVNCVRRESTFMYPTQAPWVGAEVTIIRGPYARRTGSIRHTQVSRHKDCLRVSIYIPELDYSARVDDVDVHIQGTSQHISDVFPLGPTPGLDRSLRKAQVPWKGVRVGLIKGHYKGATATVRDVTRTYNSSSVSGLEVTVELDIIRPGMGLEKIFYEFVRELRSGWPLNDFRPVTETQQDFLPNFGYVGNVVHFTVKAVAWKELAISESPSRASTPIMDPHEASTLISGDERASTPVPPNDPNQQMDVWNPDYENWEPSAGPPPSSPPPSSPLPSNSTSIAASPSHFLSHPKLVGMKVLVDIISGAEATLSKAKGVYVELYESSITVVEARLSKTKTKSVIVPLESISRFRKPPTPDSLMVIISGENQHIGKVIRRAGTLGSGEGLVFICVVFDGQDDKSKMTGEILEVTLEQVMTVEEPPQVRFWAKNLMQLILAHARVALKSRQTPGERNYESWTALIKGQNDNIARAMAS